MDKFQEALKLIRKKSALGKWEEVKLLIIQHELLESNHVDIINALINICILEGNIHEAKILVERGLLKHEFNADMNFNAGVVSMMLEAYDKALYHFIWVQRLDAENSSDVVPYIDEIRGKLEAPLFSEIASTVNFQSQNVYKAFPGKVENPLQSYLGGYFSMNEKKYYVGNYQRNQRVYFDRIAEVPVEIYNANEWDQYRYDCIEETMIPIMINQEDQEIIIDYNQEHLKISGLQTNCFHYYKFPKGSRVKIQSKNNLIVANPIVQNIDPEQPKLILNVFIDGLSQYLLNQEGLENIMPNTANFFKKGTICSKAYSAGEWSYVSVANYFTGKYTINHRQYHPDFNSISLHRQPLFSEVFQQKEYLTTTINGNWRCSPLNGYAKGFDRTLYCHGYYGMDSREVISETMEHLYAFSNKNHFMWICLFDLHDIGEELKTSIGTQINLEAKDNIVNNTEQKSVYKKYDSKKIAQYKSQLKKMDMYLTALYQFIEDNYSDDEMLISLVSDHGQSFLKDTSNYLDEHRTHIPIMLRGKNIPKGICNDIIQSNDLFPTMLHCLGLQETFKHDGQVTKYFGGEKEREYALAETLFPNKPYQIIFFDKHVKIQFKSVENCSADGRIPNKGFNVQVFDVLTDEDITGSAKDKINYYENIMYKHIQEYIR